MKRKRSVVVVIGTGPSSSSFCQRMYDLNYKVIVLSKGHVKDVSYPNRVSRIDGSPEIWKLNNSQINVKTSIEKDNDFCHVKVDGVGGLTNRWGGGIAKLNDLDMGVSASIAKSIMPYYDYIEDMIGTSSNISDPLCDYLGKFGEHHFSDASRENKSFKSTKNVLVGKAAQAILFNKGYSTIRKSCNFCGHCSVFCGRKSFYTANDTFLNLRHFHQIEEDFDVQSITKKDKNFEVLGLKRGATKLVKADFVILAAGPVNSYSILEKTFLHENYEARKLLNTPSLRGIVFAPFRKFSANQTAINTVARIKLGRNENAFMSFVEGQSIPISDWLSLMPIKNNLMAWCVQKVRKYFIAYMVFFNSDHSDNKVDVRDNVLTVSGGRAKSFLLARKLANKHLRKFFRKNMFMDIFFMQEKLQPGRDIHYGGILPMSSNSANSTTPECELKTCSGIYVIDASWMPRISEKSHTFTLMANAARVADIVHKQIVD